MRGEREERERGEEEKKVEVEVGVIEDKVHARACHFSSTLSLDPSSKYPSKDKGKQN